MEFSLFRGFGVGVLGGCEEVERLFAVAVLREDHADLL